MAVVIDVEQLGPLVIDGTLELTGPFWESGIVVVDTTLLERLSTTVQVPYISSAHTVTKYALNSTASLSLNSSYTNTNESATIGLYRPFRALSDVDKQNMDGAEDPTKIVAGDLTGDMQLTWMFEACVSAKTNGEQNDISGATAPANKLNYDTLVASRAKFGAESSNIAAFVTHSDQQVALLGIKDTTGNPIFIQPKDGGQPMLFGVPVIYVDGDANYEATREIADPTLYHSYWFKKGSVYIHVNGDAAAFEEQRYSERAIPVTLYSGSIAGYVHAYKKMPRGIKSGAVHIKHK